MFSGRSALQTIPPTVRRKWSLSNVQWHWFIIGNAWAAFLALVYAFANHFPYGLDAFDVYYQAALALAQGETPYQGINGWNYLYPPLLAQLLVPMTFLDDHAMVVNIWFGLHLVLLAGTFGLLARYVRADDAKWLWIAPIFFFPFWQALYLGQITIVMLALLVACWAALKEGQKVIAGSILALAIWIKVFPFLLVLYFLWRRDWAVLYGTFIVGVGLAAFQVLILGPELMQDFIDVLWNLTARGQPAATHENLSVFAFASRLFQQNDHVRPLWVHSGLFAVIRFGLTCFFLGVTGCAICFPHTAARRFNGPGELEYGLVLITVLLCGSTLWVSGLPPLLLVYVLVLRQRRRLPHRTFVTLACGLSYVLITVYQPLVFFSMGTALPALVLSIGFFGVVLLWLVLVYLLLTHRGVWHRFGCKVPAGVIS